LLAEQEKATLAFQYFHSGDFRETRESETIPDDGTAGG